MRNAHSRLDLHHKPLVTFIIPAWNGGEYLGAAIDSILRIESPHIELFVSVDESADNTLEVAHSFEDSRMTVVTTGGKIPMAAHYERCLKLGKGTWISVVGQDDAVFPDFLVYFVGLLARFPDADAIFFRRAYYYWPGCESLYGNQRMLYGGLSERSRVESGPRLIRSVLRGTREHHDLPQTYTNGVVRRTLVESMTAHSGGKFFQEPTPDVYSGFAICLAASKVVRSEVPLFWTGSSPRSVGFSITTTSKHSGNIKAQQIASEHFSSAKKMGYTFAQGMPEELWRQADNSSIWAISSLRKVPYATERWRSSRVARLGFASFVCNSWLQMIPLFSKKQARKSSPLVLQAACDMGISVWSIRLVAILLIPVQMGRRIRTMLDRLSALMSRRLLRITASSGELAMISIAEATNLVIASGMRSRKDRVSGRPSTQTRRSRRAEEPS